MVDLVPHALKDAPALIESVFPAQKVSFEAQRERKAGAGQTLTALGSYWKGRKPLILVRAIVLGSLLPQTENAQKDLEVFEKLMAFDDEGLARRAVIQNKLKPKDLAAVITLGNPWVYFQGKPLKHSAMTAEMLSKMSFPLDADDLEITLKWQRNVNDTDKAKFYKEALSEFSNYEAKAAICKRPEEVDQKWLYEPVWSAVNQHYKHLGINANTHEELVEQLGMLRYGHRPKVGDTFSGGGSIPFEAARLGCDVYASDLNPIACMLTWGALNIVGASSAKRKEIEQAQRELAMAVDQEITELGIEHDEHGNRAKAYLYCLETRCPETGWMVPMSPSWVISPRQNTIARLIPDENTKSFVIDIVSGVSEAELQDATVGTVQNGVLQYELHGKVYKTPVKTLRGDYKEGKASKNKLRKWSKNDFKPANDDIFQERLYAIHWITQDTLDQPRKETFFTAVGKEDLSRERMVDDIVAKNLSQWQKEGLVPDMEIMAGDKTDEPIRTRGWTYWRHLFSPRDLLNLSIVIKKNTSPELIPGICGLLDFCSKLSRWIVRFSSGGGSDFTSNVFSNQALNTLYNWANRSYIDHDFAKPYQYSRVMAAVEIQSHQSEVVNVNSDIWITDPPYADAVNYHEITEFFIAWLRKNPPAPFDQWVWDSRRALAVKGSGDDFRKGMVGAYSAMAKHMPDNGMQCVMFTYQDKAGSTVWPDMVGIFWAAGLQVVAAWYIATETTSELKKGGHVQGTVTLMLRKRSEGEKQGFRNRVLPMVRGEVKRQVEQMLNLDESVFDVMGESVFNDSDLQMAGYAAALKVLTGFTHIDGEDVTNFALRPRKKGEVTVVDEIVQQAAEAASNLLVPDGLEKETWLRLSGIQRFYLKMMDIETTGAAKLDNYQNFAKAFRVDDYARVMGSMTPTKAQLKTIPNFESRDLNSSSEIGATYLGNLIVAIQQLLEEVEPSAVIQQLQADLPDFMEVRALLIDMCRFIAEKSREATVRSTAELLGDRLKNLRALGQ